MMKSIALWTLAFSCLSLTITGCYYPEEDSCNIKTGGIYAEYSVKEVAGEAYVEAVFWTGDTPGGTNLELGVCGDRIEVNGRKLSVQSDNATRYGAFVPESEAYVFTFVRPDEGAYESAATQIPEPIRISAPVADAIPRSEPVTVQWENNGDSTGGNILQMGITGSCIQGYFDNIADDGQHTVEAGRMNIAGNVSCCTAKVVLTRHFHGAISPHLKGRFTGTVQSVTYFDSLPPAFSDTSATVDTAGSTAGVGVIDTEENNTNDTP